TPTPPQPLMSEQFQFSTSFSHPSNNQTNPKCHWQPRCLQASSPAPPQSSAVECSPAKSAAQPPPDPRSPNPNPPPSKHRSPDSAPSPDTSKAPPETPPHPPDSRPRSRPPQ